MSNLDKFMNDDDSLDPLIAAALNLSYNATAKAVAVLEEKGILRQMGKEGKATIYSYADYLDILRKDD